LFYIGEEQVAIHYVASEKLTHIFVFNSGLKKSRGKKRGKRDDDGREREESSKRGRKRESESE
jgi:hypothetical protein